jgi:hypothetical protein
LLQLRFYVLLYNITYFAGNDESKWAKSFYFLRATASGIAADGDFSHFAAFQ